MSSKENTWAVIAYMTFIGLLIAIIMNQKERNELTSYHIRQMIGLCIFAFLVQSLYFLPFIGGIITALGGLVAVFLWVVSLTHAVNHKTRPVPIFGQAIDNLLKPINF